MRRLAKLTAVFLAALVVSGCYSSGLSMREKGSYNYSNFIYGLYKKDSGAETEFKKISTPIKLAVAQVGENAPPKAFMDKLNKESSLISKLVIIPAGGGEPDYYNKENEPGLNNFGAKMAKMQMLAKDLGADYIFLFGGSIDTGEMHTWLGLFDITLIGGYFIPSNKILAEGRASGALIDVESSRVVFVVSSETNTKEYVPTYNVDGRQDAVMVKVRNKLVSALADECIQKLRIL